MSAAVSAEVEQAPLGSPTSSGTLARRGFMFAVVGAGTTALYVALFAVLDHLTGVAQAANIIALVVATVVNTAANRHWTFGVRTSDGAFTHHMQGLVVFAITWALTAGALALMAVLAPHATTMWRTAAVITATLVTTVGKFAAMHRWMFS